MTDKYTARLVLFICGALPFFFLHTFWANAALVVYSMTAGLFGILLLGEYPPVGTSWFWRAILAIISLHSVVVLGLAVLNLEIPVMNKLPRLLYSLLGIVVVAEWRLSLRIIEASEPKG